jgi:hypothetical protein
MAYVAKIIMRLNDMAAVSLPLLEIQRAAVVSTIQMATPPWPNTPATSSGIRNSAEPARNAVRNNVSE